MDFDALQAKRESCRAYSGRPVSWERLTRLVDVSRRLPSGCSIQP